MLSGVGNQASLKSLGIKTIVDVPDVGENMQDHAFVAVQWTVNSTKTIDTLNDQPALFNAALAEYDQTHTGILADNPAGNQIGWFRLPEDSPILKTFGDPTGGPVSPHFELMFEVCKNFPSTIDFNICISNWKFLERIFLFYSANTHFRQLFHHLGSDGFSYFT